VKETGRTENNGSRAIVSVEQNVPGEATGATPGENSKSQKDRKEELTNYELNSKVVSTISSGYRIDGMTVAVVVNRKQVLAALGANATQEAVDAQLKQLQTVVETAVGVDEKRGDRVSVTALDFMSDGSAFPPVPEPSFIEVLMRQAGSFINAAAIIIATLLLILLGLRPAIQAIMAEAPPEPAPVALEREAQPAAIAPAREPAAPLPDITGPTTQARLEEVVDNFEAEAATLLKQWMKA
jgi:flagellar M-ring protein FliF